ncbi:hypothetical protein ALT785_120003 [Alteromonas infernus]
MEWNVETLSLLSIPLISAIVGWLTNYLAVKMMFYPIEFVGIKPFFGWQGLIPAKRRQMAEIEVELVLGKLLSVEELAQRLDADELTKAIERRLSQVIRKVINDVMAESAPQLWAALPVKGKNLVYQRIENDIPNVVHKMVDDFQHNVSEILDIKELVVEQLVNAPELVNEIFLTAGSKEFPFIVRSGLYFGFFIWLTDNGVLVPFSSLVDITFGRFTRGVCHQLDRDKNNLRAQTTQKNWPSHNSGNVFKAPKRGVRSLLGHYREKADYAQKYYPCYFTWLGVGAASRAY